MCCYNRRAIGGPQPEPTCFETHKEKIDIAVGATMLLATISMVVMSILALTGVVSPTALSISLLCSGGAILLSSALLGSEREEEPRGFLLGLGVALVAAPFTFGALLITNAVNTTVAASSILATYGTITGSLASLAITQQCVKKRP